MFRNSISRSLALRVPALPRQRGIGLPAVIFIITTLVLIIAAMAQLQQNTSDGLSLQLLSQRAFYAAESGAQLSMNLLLPPAAGPARSCSTSPFYTHAFNAPGLTGCSVSVSCRELSLDGSPVYILNSTGQCGSGALSASRQTEVAVR